MALRWMDGFEYYGASETHLVEGVGGAAAWSEVDNGWELDTTNPATGTSHMRLTEDIDGANIVMRRALGQASQVSGLAYRFQVDELPSTENNTRSESHLVMCEWRDVANDAQCRVCLGTDGSVYFCRGDTQINRSDPCIAPGGYHHFEAKAKIANSGGYVEVRINEVTVLNLTGIDTQSTANASTAQIAYGQYGNVTSTSVGFGFMDVDDVFAWDDDTTDLENTVIDFVGDKGCYYLAVNGDTAEADWTKSTGVTGHTLLDETTPNDADYIADTTGAARSIFDVAALPGNVAEVIAMMPVVRARKEESGTVTLRGGVVVDASESYTPDNSPSTSFAYMTPGPKTIDPDTGVAWANDADPKLLIERTA